MMVCLPEHFAYMSQANYVQGGDMTKGFPYRIGDGKGGLFDRYRQLALDHQVWLSLGSFPEGSSTADKTYMTHVIVNEEGNIASTYRKLHMFDVDLAKKGGVDISESDCHSPGHRLAEPCFSPVGYLGLSISYDLRFPELYRHLILKGAQLLLIPSAFLQKTGSSQWETLLRTRAIENQAYVIASAQVADKTTGSAVGFGHSMIVDPWGDIVAQCSDKEGYVLCEIDLGYLDRVRSNMNCLTHIRTDVLLQPDVSMTSIRDKRSTFKTFDSNRGSIN